MFYLVNSSNNKQIVLNNVHERFHVNSQTGLLSISNTQRDDSGLYECLAQNILGSANEHIKLLVRRMYKKNKRKESSKDLFSIIK